MKIGIKTGLLLTAAVIAGSVVAAAPASAAVSHSAAGAQAAAVQAPAFTCPTGGYVCWFQFADFTGCVDIWGPIPTDGGAWNPIPACDGVHRDRAMTNHAKDVWWNQYGVNVYYCWPTGSRTSLSPYNFTQAWATTSNSGCGYPAPAKQLAHGNILNH